MIEIFYFLYKDGYPIRRRREELYMRQFLRQMPDMSNLKMS